MFLKTEIIYVHRYMFPLIWAYNSSFRTYQKLLTLHANICNLSNVITIFFQKISKYSFKTQVKL